MDVDAFIKTNASTQALKEALIKRDQYYSDIADAAAKALNTVKDFETRYQKECEKNSRVQKELDIAKETLARLKNELKATQSNNKALRKTLDEHVKPAIAQELLKKSGYLSSSTETLVTSDDFDEKIITADTDLQSELAAELLDAFED